MKILKFANHGIWLGVGCRTRQNFRNLTPDKLLKSLSEKELNDSENPRVGSSILSLGTSNISRLCVIA
jgi:hypothetical protein